MTSMTGGYEIPDGDDAGDDSDSGDGAGDGGRVVLEQSVLLTLLANAAPLPEPRPVLRVVLCWDSDDPLLVTVSFPATGPEARWCWGRDVLHAGLTEPAGVGDVRVRPHGAGQVQIELSSPSGRAVLAAPAEQLRTFLGRTFAVIAAGAEYAPGSAAGESFDFELMLIESGPVW